jgi:hypothetical protein
MSQPDPLSPTTDPAGHTDASGGWRRLPPQARSLFVLSGLMLAVPAGFAAQVLARVFGFPFAWSTSLAIAVLGGGFGAWLGLRRYRHTRWLLDPDGFSLRKGRMWQSDIRVPVNRVQHLDLRRGPLERRYGLATLVIHTAGTRDSAVNVGGLDAADAEALRDLLARQVEHDQR